VKKLILATALVALALGLSTHAPADEPARMTPTRPRLAVVVVIDQFRYDYLSRFEDLFDPDGGAFLRFKREGAYFTNANYGHATTYTGPGHAHILTGGYACETGMVGNRWFDRASGKVVAIAGDPESHFVGGPGDEGEGTSPKNMLTTTVGDELLLDGRSKVVTIALKSRAAILLGGKLGKAYWFNEKTGGFATSTYYAASLPPWVAAWNERKLADACVGKTWTPSVPESAFSRASEDDMPWEGDLFGLGRTFPHPIKNYEAACMSPHGNDLELDFARAAIEAEKLGTHEGPDLLAVSLSANDEVGHTFGPMSREVVDMTARTDRQLGAFLRWVEARVPGTLVVFTADHGASPIPEYMARCGVEAHRIKKKELQAAVEKELGARFGEGKWVAGLEDPSVYLDEKLIAEQKLSRAEVEDAAARALERIPGIARCFTRTQLLRGEHGATAIERSYELCFYPERSGDVLIVTKPYSFWGKYAEKDYGDSHGSPYGYDTHVPLVFMGPGVRSGVVHESVVMAGLAPTLATLLGVDAPPCAHEPVLARALDGR
jgi:arylsulfatase A-like enzyme